MVYRPEWKGSACECVFRDAETLQEYSLKLNSLGRVMAECQAPCWMARKKSRQELAPSRVLAALQRTVGEIEAKRETPGKVERKNLGRAIKVDGRQFFAVAADGSVTVGHLAKERYTPNQIDDLCGWALAAR